MPRGDGTGPMGAGPMTGRAAGFCAGYATPGFANSAGGRGLGMGMGRGRGFAAGGRGGGFGFRNRAFAPAYTQAPVMSEEQEKTFLDNEIKALENELDAAKKRANELKKQ